MQKNPYKFTGPLDPVGHKNVCVFRSKEINEVIEGIMQGEYWTILGPRQIGKTTLLRQIRNELSAFPSIYINLEVSPETDEAFYDWIMNILLENFNEKPTADMAGRWKEFGYDLNFYHFLKNFTPGKHKKIILFLDEIEKASAIKPFLKIWRKIYHDRMDRQELKKYVLVIAGAVDLVPLTLGPTSPFNIARKLFLSNLTKEESEELIGKPFNKLGVKIEPKAKEKIITQTSGHPQLLQHICYILVEIFLEEGKSITIGDVEEVIDKLFTKNDVLKTLGRQVETDKAIRNLVRRVLKGEKIDYAPYQHFSMSGAGPIVEQGHYCKIRNNIYERFLKKFIRAGSLPLTPSKEYITSIYLKEKFDGKEIKEKEGIFLNCLFDPNNVSITIAWNDTPPKEINLNRTEKLIFCYLAYQKYKARIVGVLSSIKKYHFSSVPKKNRKQIPEWDILVKEVNKESTLYKEAASSDMTIRNALFKIRKKLEEIDAHDLIPKLTGRGDGYWLKGTVIFTKVED